MALEIIGPGFGRTGTASLKQALEMLGFGPCHHMFEVQARPEQVPHWVALSEERPVDWDAVFAGFRAQIDWPGAHAWRQLAAHYPAAKVLFTVRDEDAWWRSFSDTIAPLLAGPPAADAPPHRQAMRAAMRRMLIEQTFGAPLDDRAACIAALRRRTAEVRAAIPPERLLVFDVTEGWSPLCRFLGVAEPDAAFPRGNTTEEFLARRFGAAPPGR